ncbi:hypothetical protein YC2023_119948 [Brassica napus]
MKNEATRLRFDRKLTVAICCFMETEFRITTLLFPAIYILFSKHQYIIVYFTGLGILRGVHRQVLTLVGCGSGSRIARKNRDLRFYLDDLNAGGYTPQNREAVGLVPAIGDSGCAGGGRRRRFLDGLVAAAALDFRRASLGGCLMAQL